MKIYIIRHGETYGNLNGNGFSETDLTPNGIQQALWLGERFKEEKIDKLYASPLTRAVKTANCIIEHHPSTPFIIDGTLLEKGTAPDYKGLPEDELNKICKVLPKYKNITFLGEEDAQKAYSRAKSFIKKVKNENDFDDTIVIVAHGTFNSFLVLAALDFPLKENFNFSHLNTGVTLVQYLKEDGVIKTKLKYLNDTSHLITKTEL